MVTTQNKFDYEDFHLLIDQAQNGYIARVIDSSVGETDNAFDLPFDEQELSTFTWISNRNLRHLRLQPPNDVKANELTPHEFGTRLFNAVFAGEVRTCLELHLSKCADEGKGLRIRLRLTTNVPDLAYLPWEYLSRHNRFIALSNRTVLIRYIELSAPPRPLSVNPPLRILVLVSHPIDAVQLQLENEWARLEKALANLVNKGLVDLERLPSATLNALQERLRNQEKAIHILHFVGHGYFNEQKDLGGLVLEDEQKHSQCVDADRFATLLQDHRSLRLVFLNACEGARGGRSSFFVGTAQRLVQHEIPAVLAMQFPVSDKAAITLAAEFYKAIAANYPVDAALAEARKAVYMDNEWEWGTPVLFSRSKDNRILELAQYNRVYSE